MSTLLVKLRGDADADAFIDTAGGLVDCNLGVITNDGNSPRTSKLDIPVENAAALAKLVTDDHAVITSALVEVTIDGTLMRFVPTSARPSGDGATITVGLADRRSKRRYVGRTGSPVSLTPDFYNATPGATPAGWTPNPGAPDTLTFNPAGTGVFGVTAEELTASGPGPMNCVSAGWIGDTVDFDRNVGFGAFVFLPSGSWAPNNDGQLLEILAYDTDQTDDNGDNLVVDVAVANITVSDEWALAAGHVRIPAGKTYNVEFRLFAPDGTVRYQLAALAIQEALSWTNVDLAQQIIDLVAHANDTTNWGHSDTGIRADSTSIPTTGVLTSRTIRSAEKHKVIDAINEAANTAGLWLRLVAEDDGTDTLTADTGGAVAAVTASDDNSDLGAWEWDGSDHADMLGMFAPDGVADITGDRLIMWAGPSGLLTGLGEAYDLGDELYIAGPWGNYDPRTVAGLLIPFYQAKANALAVPITFKTDAAGVLAAALSGDLRPGCLLDATVGTGALGIDGRFLIASVAIDPRTFRVAAQLNRVA